MAEDIDRGIWYKAEGVKQIKRGRQVDSAVNVGDR
jgi:hypothetical protein